MNIAICLPSARDVERGVVRLQHRADGQLTLPLTANEWAALPKEFPINGLRIKERPLLGAVARLIREYLAAAPKCKCGQLRQFKMRFCNACTGAYLAANRPIAVPFFGTGKIQIRTADHRENRRETKGQND